MRRFLVRRFPKIIGIEHAEETASQDHGTFMPCFQSASCGRDSRHGGLELSVRLLSLTSFAVVRKIFTIVAQNLVLSETVSQTFRCSFQDFVLTFAYLRTIGPRPLEVIHVVRDAIFVHAKRVIFNEVSNGYLLYKTIAVVVTIQMTCKMSDCVFSVYNT